MRATKWNASLILLRDYAELVSLCKVMFWKTHIPVRTQKWPPHLIFAGACHGIVINYVTALILTMVTASKLVRQERQVTNMTEHVSRQCRLWSFFQCALNLRGSVGFFRRGILTLSSIQ